MLMLRVTIQGGWIVDGSWLDLDLIWISFLVARARKGKRDERVFVARG